MGRSITAVLDDLGKLRGVVSRGTSRSDPLRCSRDPSVSHHSAGRARRLCRRRRNPTRSKTKSRLGRDVGTGELQHVVNPDMPVDEEIRGAWARSERLAASPATYALMRGLAFGLDVGRSFRPSVCRLLSSSASRTARRLDPRRASTSPSTLPHAKTLRCRAATCSTS